ncbi:hypothetical protein D3C86_970380 [compost metagenome]
MLGGSRLDGFAPAVECRLQPAADQVVDAQLIERTVPAGAQGFEEGKQRVVFDAQVGDELVDAKRPAPQQETLALCLPQAFVPIAAQYGNLVQLADLRGPTAHQHAADTRVVQYSLDARQGIGDGTHTHGESDQFKKTHGDSAHWFAKSPQPKAAPAGGILRLPPSVTAFSAVF